MTISRHIFPTGAILTVGGVLLYAALEKYSFVNTQDWLFKFLLVTFLPALLVGTPLAIVGAVVDLRRLTPSEKKGRGLLCWIVAGISLASLILFGTVHGWTVSFFFPAVSGFFCGAIYLAGLLRKGS
jgi:hypothetical protein